MYLESTNGRHIEDMPDNELRAIMGDVHTSPKDRAVISQELTNRVRESDKRAAKGQPVHVVAIDVPFTDMVALMVKWGLAAIPAMIILSLVGAVIFGVFSAMLK